MASLRALVVFAIVGFICVSAQATGGPSQSSSGPLSPLVNAIGNLLTNIIKIVKQLLDQLLPTVNSLLQDELNNVKQLLNQIITNLQTILDRLLDGLLQVLGNGSTGLLGSVNDLLNSVVGSLSGILRSVGQVVGGLTGSLGIGKRIQAVLPILAWFGGCLLQEVPPSGHHRTQMVVPSGERHQGVRIVEFESNELELDGERVDAEVELWDCSGDRKFESCWPAIRHGTNGAILVVNPEQATGEQLLLWYNEFVQKIGLRQEHVLVLLHHTSEQTNDSAIADFKLPSQMQGIVCIPSNIDREGEALRLEFNNFLCNVITDTKGRKTDCALLLLRNKTIKFHSNT
uniref:Uncharacterized protein n=1 Tax=Acrobeloides nanus TaxID=290746 RepID=A0A914BUZ5_9BILA